MRAFLGIIGGGIGAGHGATGTPYAPVLDSDSLSGSVAGRIHLPRAYASSPHDSARWRLRDAGYTVGNKGVLHGRDGAFISIASTLPIRANLAIHAIHSIPLAHRRRSTRHKGVTAGRLDQWRLCRAVAAATRAPGAAGQAWERRGGGDSCGDRAAA